MKTPSLPNSVYALVSIACLAHGDEVRADWPMQRGNAGRTSYTSEPLPENLSLAWKRVDRHGPRRAWPSRLRLQFDHTFYPVAAGDSIYFGSSADDRVVAIDADSGKTRWVRFTDGPVRFAPVIWRDRLFVASDDGVLYCMTASDGEVLWRVRGGPRDERLLGNDRVISRWPARGGPVLLDDVLYFAAGIWPSEGIYVHAIDPRTGETIWRNGSAGSLEMPKPRGGVSKSGPAAHGYLAAEGATLIVPTGRGAPAAFDRDTGRLRYFRHAEHKANGGSFLSIVDEMCVFRNNYPGVGQRVAALADGEGIAGFSGTLIPVAVHTEARDWQQLDRPRRQQSLRHRPAPVRRRRPSPRSREEAGRRSARSRRAARYSLAVGVRNDDFPPRWPNCRPRQPYGRCHLERAEMPQLASGRRLRARRSDQRQRAGLTTQGRRWRRDGRLHGVDR